jgi:hypothetical protein
MRLIPVKSASASLRRVDEAADTEHEHGQVDEGVKRGSRAVHSVAQSAEALETTERALDHVALSLERSILSIELTDRLLSWAAPPCRNERSGPALLHKSI